jgi:hypothetical protein
MAKFKIVNDLENYINNLYLENDHLPIDNLSFEDNANMFGVYYFKILDYNYHSISFSFTLSDLKSNNGIFTFENYDLCKLVAEYEYMNRSTSYKISKLIDGNITIYQSTVFDRVLMINHYRCEYYVDNLSTEICAF